MDEDSPYRGPQTESHIIGEHFSRIGRSTEAPIWNSTPVELWVGTYGIMVDHAETVCYPWLRDNKEYQELKKELDLKVPEDPESYHEIMEYINKRNKQLRAIYMAVHEAGVIYPRDIPLEDAKELLSRYEKDIQGGD